METKRKGKRKNLNSTVQLFFCNSCQKKFSLGKESKKKEIVRRHLEDCSSYRTIQRRNKCSRNTACKYVKELSLEIKGSYWIAKNLRPRWKGVLCFDGTYINVKNQFASLARRRRWHKDERFLHKMIALLSTDFHSRDLPHYSLGDNENKIDLVIHFSQLKENGYKLKVLVRDGNKRIQEAVKHVYGLIPAQLCHKHFLDKFDEKIACKELRREREDIIELKNRVCSIIRVNDIELAIRRMNEFARNKNRFITSKTTQELIDKFMANFENLTMFLQYPKNFVPTTVNISENMNNQLKMRFKPMNSFQSVITAENYLKLWCLKRRFQKFTDCKKPYRHFNGKAPLEIAGVNITNLDYLNLGN